MHKWYRLDNAAIVFPSVSGSKNSSVFRFAVVLKEQVNPVSLQKAVDIVMPRFPMFTVRLRQGIFWNYLDENRHPLKIKKEINPPCEPISDQDDGYSLRVLYHRYRISIEMFHALTDGGGAIELLKTLVYYYFLIEGHEINHENKILLAKDAISRDELEDSFSANYTPIYAESISSPASYHLKGVRLEGADASTISGVTNGDQLNQLAKSYSGSITAYLASLLLMSIYQTRKAENTQKKPIVIAVPVNLRPVFHSKTLKNFFTVVNVGAYMNDEMTLKELVPQIQEMLLQKTSKSNLQSAINHNVNFERNLASKFVPLFVKKIAVRIGFGYLSERRKTITLTNLGRMNLPKEMLELIEHAEIFAYPTQHSPMACGVISCGDKLTISFIKNIVDTDVPQYFFSHLASQEGLEVFVYSNSIEEKFEESLQKETTRPESS